MIIIFLHIFLCCCSGLITKVQNPVSLENLSSNSQTHKNVVSAGDAVLRIDSSELPEISCPYGHHITVVNAFIKCNHAELDVTEEVWNLCRHKNYCKLNESIYKQCTDKSPHFKHIQFSCIKLLGYDCGLFYGVDVGDEEMCQMLCLNYVRSCTSRYDLVPREHFLMCLAKMFSRNDINICQFLPDSKLKEYNSFKLDYYLKPKYILESVEINNYEWTELRYKEEIENPIVIISPLNTVHNIIVLVNNITSAAASLILHCVAESNRRIKLLADVLIISIGNHSTELGKQIVVGLIKISTDETVKLPLDPADDWVIVLKSQTDVIVTTILHDDNSVKLESRGRVSRVKLGYLAISKVRTDSTLLYENEVKYKQTNVRDVKLTVYSVPFVTPVHKITDPTVHNVTLNGFEGASVLNRESMLELIPHYDVLMRFKVSDAAVTLNIITLESSVIVWIKRICKYVRRVNLISKRNCYHQCVNSSYLRECLQGDTSHFFSCYRTKSENCEILNLVSLAHLVLQYRNDILTHYFITNTINNNNTINNINTINNFNTVNNFNTGNRIRTVDNNNSPNTNNTIVSGNTVNSVGSSDTSDTTNTTNTVSTLRMGSVYSEWSEWSECSKICNDDVSMSIKIRRRLVYYSGHSNDQTLQSVECHKILPCNQLCYYRTVNTRDGNSVNSNTVNSNTVGGNTVNSGTIDRRGVNGVERGRYFFVWNVGCKMKRERIDLGDKLITVAKIYEVSEYDQNCDYDFNYSACDRPNNDPNGHRHLLLNIKCPATKPCKPTHTISNSRDAGNTVEDSVGDNTVDNTVSNTLGNNVEEGVEMCLMYNVEYDGESWVRDGSCICPENTIPCNSSEVFNKDFSGVGMQEHVSLSGYERLVVPLGYIKVPTFDFFSSDSQLENYCSNGNVNYETLSNELLYVSCDNIGNYSSNYTVSIADCVKKCESMEKECESEMSELTELELIKCLKKFIKESTKFDVIVFRNYLEKYYKSVQIDDISTVAHLIDAICIDEKLHNLCLTTVNNIVTECKFILEHTFQNNVKKCLNRRVKELQKGEKLQNVYGFGCGFRKERKIIGNGLIYCKEIHCQFSDYSKWLSNQIDNSVNSVHNNTKSNVRSGNLSGVEKLYDKLYDKLFDKLSRLGEGLDEERIVRVMNELETSVRIRFRNVITGGKSCHNISKLIQIYPTTLATELTQDSDDNQHKFSRIILTNLVNLDNTVHNTVANDNTVDNSVVLRDSVVDVTGDGINCRIYLGQKQIQNTKLIIQRNRCSCPYGMIQCSIEESLRSRDWNKQLSLVCNNKMRSILFLNRNSFYRYSCLSLSYIKEDFESVKELCNEDDGMTFISCSGQTSLLEVFLMASFMAFLGITSSSILLTYLHKIKHISLLN